MRSFLHYPAGKAKFNQAKILDLPARDSAYHFAEGAGDETERLSGEKGHMHHPIQKNPSVLEWSMRALDVILLWSAGQLSSLLRFNSLLNEAAPIHTILLYLCCVLAYLLFPLHEVYGSWRGRALPTMFANLAISWALVLILGLMLSFVIHHVGALSRLWMLSWYVAGLSLLLLSRAILYSALRFLRSMGLNGKRVVIVGYGKTGQEMHKRAGQQGWYGYDVKAIHVGVENLSHPPRQGVDEIATLEGIHDYVVANQINEIWITLPLSASADLLTLQYLLRNALVDIRLIPDTHGMQFLSNKVINFLGFAAVDLNQPRADGARVIVKELFDRVFSATVLVLLLPLFIVIAIGIKLSSSGPIFFRQARLGLNGKPFYVYKFRSMKLHDESGALMQAKQDDARVTRIGNFLRRTSLDELPQFINVLMGDMSVVGPRPHALQHNEMYKDKVELYMLRHRVKPGITGWAQINGFRGETDTDDKMAMRVQFDLHYIQNWSFWMDLKIIAWTGLKGWTGSNAY
jgi:putative colanic acid biosynthesis UDP-glucose lipid carrier transferase